MVSAKLSLGLAFLSFTTAAPIPFLSKLVDGVKTAIGANDVKNKQSPGVLSQDDVTKAFSSAAQFARAAYCSPASITAWKCGEACDANPQTEVLVAGGDGGITPQYFVAFDPPSKSIVISHEGTKKSNVLSVLNDLEFALKKAPENRFPGADGAGAQIHSGFLATFERTIDQILPAVQQGIKDKGATNVLLTGHSLGAAISLLDSVFLRSKLDPSIKMTTSLFGLPRTGNPEWAEHIQKTLASDKFQFFVNGADPVPKIPPTNLGFRHPTGELFQKNGTSLQTLGCPGQENENCSASISLLKLDISAHKGPYAGVLMGSPFCKA